MIDIIKYLHLAFIAGENYSNAGEFAYYAPTFEEWFMSIETKLVEENTNDLVNLVRFVISQWASLNEQSEPDHEALINKFIKVELVEYIEKYKNELIQKNENK